MSELETERQNLRNSVTALRTAIIAHADNLAAIGEENQLHRNNKNNPHNVTKAQLELALVENYPIATTQDMIDGTSLTHYVTPALLPVGFETHGNAVVMELDIRPPRNQYPAANASIDVTTPVLKVSSFGFSQLVGTRHPVSKVFEIDLATGDFSSPVITQVVPYYDDYAPTLTANTAYKWRCKFIDDQDTHSEWSLPTSFTVLPAKVNKPTVVAPLNATTLEGRVTLQGSAFSVSSGSHVHSATQWEIATDVGFTQVVYQSIDTDTRKTLDAARLLVPNTTHYVRVRYKAEDTLWSLWSNTVSFLYELPTTVLMTAPVRNNAYFVTQVYDDTLYHLSVTDNGSHFRLIATTLNGTVVYSRLLEIWPWNVSGERVIPLKSVQPMVITENYIYAIVLRRDTTDYTYLVQIDRLTGDVNWVRGRSLGLTADTTTAGLSLDGSHVLLHGGLNNGTTGYLLKISNTGTLVDSCDTGNVGPIVAAVRNADGYLWVLTAGVPGSQPPHLIRSNTANSLLIPYNGTDYHSWALSQADLRVATMVLRDERIYIGGYYGTSPSVPVVHIVRIAGTTPVSKGYVYGTSAHTGHLKDLLVTDTTLYTTFRQMDASATYPAKALFVHEQPLSYADATATPTLGTAGFCYTLNEETDGLVTLGMLSNGQPIVTTGIINNVEYTVNNGDVLPVVGLTASVANQSFPYHLGLGLVEADTSGTLRYSTTNVLAASVDAITSGSGVNYVTPTHSTSSVDDTFEDRLILTLSEL